MTTNVGVGDSHSIPLKNSDGGVNSLRAAGIFPAFSLPLGQKTQERIPVARGQAGGGAFALTCFRKTGVFQRNPLSTFWISPPPVLRIPDFAK